MERQPTAARLADSLPFDPIELVALDPRRNIRRRWRIAASHDLFGQLLVETSWGRIGARGRRLVRSFDGEGDAARYVRTLLARRDGAVRRIGVAYRAVDGPGGAPASGKRDALTSPTRW